MNLVDTPDAEPRGILWIKIKKMNKKNTQIIFVFEGIRYLVWDIHFGYAQHTDKTGRPSSTVRHSNITLFLIAQGKSVDREMIEHFAARRPFSGHIEFLIVDNGIENKVSGDLEFANAKFKNWGESNTYEGFEGIDLMRVVIHPLIVRYQSVVTELPRNPSNPFAERTAPVTTREETANPEISASHYETLDGKPIPESRVVAGMEVYYVLKTTGAVGQEAEIDLDSNKLDFEYEGVPLEDDILTVTVTADTMRLKLKVKPQAQNNN